MRYSLLTATVILADQATKYWVRRAIPSGASRPVIPGLIHLTHVENTGAAFGMLRGHTPLLIAITAIVLILSFLYRKSLRQERPLFRLGYTLGLAGAVGNLVDRLVLGRVTDFIDLRIWPVFNLADISISVGALLLAWGILVEPHNKERPDDE